MAVVRVPGFGRHGVVHDTIPEALPTGTWTDALNVRFTGVELQKMLEPELFAAWDFEANGRPVWFQQWADGLSTYVAVATAGALWLYYDQGLGTFEWVNASRNQPYNTDGYWDSFAWGDTCVFNNGVDAPQIFNQNTTKFEDLPRWGLLSTADDILNNRPPTRKVQASCVRLVPFKSFLVAVGVTEAGLYQPNKVWWSDSTNLAGYNGAPSWDYETPATLSGQVVIDPEGGAIRTAAVLNEQLIIYTDGGATAQLVVGGSLVMQFRRLFKKGAAGVHAVSEFNNQHFVVSQDQIYLHDGSTVVGNLIAKDRVEEEFFTRLGKGGRFGGANDDVDWNGIQVAKNPDRKEIVVAYSEPTDTLAPGAPGLCVPVVIVQEPVNAEPTGTGQVSFYVSASGTGPITYQWYEDGVLMEGETSALLTVDDTSTAAYNAVATNPCGEDTSMSAVIVPEGQCVPIQIVAQPTDQIPSGSGTVDFVVGLAGSTPFNIQWQQDTAGDNVFVDMVGEQDTTLTVPDTSVNQYRVLVSNACGAETASAVASVVNFICSAYTDELGVQGFAQLPLYDTDGVWPYPLATDRFSSDPVVGDLTKWSHFSFWISAPSLSSDWTDNFKRTDNFTDTQLPDLRVLTFCDGPILRCVRVSSGSSVNAVKPPRQLVSQNGGSIHEDYSVSMIVAQTGNTYLWSGNILKNANWRWGWDDDSGPVSVGSGGAAPVSLDCAGLIENRQLSLTVGRDDIDVDTPISEQNTVLLDIGDFRDEWIMITAEVTSAEPVILQRPVTTNRNYGYFESTLSVTVTRANGSTVSASCTGSNTAKGSSSTEDVQSIYLVPHTNYSSASLFSGSNPGEKYVAFIGYKQGVGVDLAALSQAFFNNLDN